MDSAGNEGVQATATVPALALALTPPSLTRGYFDALQPALLNSSTVTLSVGPAVLTVIDANGNAVASATSAVVSATAGQNAALLDVIATPPSLTAAALAHVAVAVPTDPGASLSFAGDFPVTAGDPPLPVIEIFPGALVAGANSPVQVRFYNRGTAPLDVITALVANSTTTPTNNVLVQLQSTQGTLLATGGLQQTDNGAATANYNGQQVFFEEIPPGQSFLFDPVQVVVPNTASSALNVAALISTPTYNLAFSPLVGTRCFKSTTTQTTVSQPAYTATASADHLFYDTGSMVTISGQALSPTGAPVPGVAIGVQLTANGFTRTVNAVSDSSGNYAAYYTPSGGDAGNFTVFAANPLVVSHGAQASFTVMGFGFTNSSIQATLAQNSSLVLSLPVTNTGATALTGLTVSTALVTGSSVTLTVSPGSIPSSIAPGASATLTATLSAAPSASTSTLTLTLTESHGFFRTLPISAAVVPASVIPALTPQSISIGMVGGTTRTVALTIQNQGFVTWHGVTLNAPSPSWVTIQGTTSIGDIPPGGNAHVTLLFAPPSSLANQTYSAAPLIQITSLNSPAVALNAAVLITSSNNGILVFNAVDADVPKSPTGQGTPVATSQVTLNSLDVAGLAFNAAGDQNGLTIFGQIPSGNYAWNATATGFQTQSGTIFVQPGMTNPVTVIMPTSVITYQWSVVPTSIPDQYNVVLMLQFATNVPAPVIVTDPPTLNLTLSIGQSAFGQFTLTNKGLVSVHNYALTTTLTDGLTMTMPFTTIAEITPGQTVVVPYEVTFVHASNPCKSLSVGGSGIYFCPYDGSAIPTNGGGLSGSAGQCPGASSQQQLRRHRHGRWRCLWPGRRRRPYFREHCDARWLRHRDRGHDASRRLQRDLPCRATGRASGAVRQRWAAA